MKKLIYLLLAMMAALSAQASSESTDSAVVRPVLSAINLELGVDAVANTYLSPLTYKGRLAAIGCERMQVLKALNGRLTGVGGARIELGRTFNDAHTSVMWNVAFRPWYSVLWMHRMGAWQIGAGPRTELELGALYQIMNGNNPVAARAAATLGATGMAAWNVKLGRLPVTFRYMPSMPLWGAFFSPQYDELYYEIWLGNRTGLVHAAWPGNFFRLDNLLTADLHLGTTNLRLGYRCEVFSGKVSGITSRELTHMFVIGIATEWIGLKAGSRRTPHAAVVSPLY